MLTPHELTGRATTHLAADPILDVRLHADCVEPLLALRAAALAAGFDLWPASGFRDFERQLAIWNGKYEGTRPLLDRAGRAVDVGLLGPAERVAAILWWSALPGASRHHWGTEVDVYDRAAFAAGSRLQLVPAEYEGDGPCAPLSAWLHENARRFGFFRPYRTDRGGVQPEPWHLSYAPIARLALQALDMDTLAQAVDDERLLGREQVLEALPDIHARYVAAVDPAPRMRSRWARSGGSVRRVAPATGRSRPRRS